MVLFEQSRFGDHQRSGLIYKNGLLQLSRFEIAVFPKVIFFFDFEWFHAARMKSWTNGSPSHDPYFGLVPSPTQRLRIAPPATLLLTRVLFSEYDWKRPSSSQSGPNQDERSMSHGSETLFCFLKCTNGSEYHTPHLCTVPLERVE
jgi:hypothetical protein